MQPYVVRNTPAQEDAETVEGIAKSEEKKTALYELSDKRSAPIPFIVGSPRSGTTLLAMMLDSHSELAMPPETHFLPKLGSLVASAENPKESFFEAITHHARWPDFQLDVSEFRRKLAALSSPFQLNDALRQFYGLYSESLGKPRWGEHTHFYGNYQKLITKLFPEAHFIHVIRDGRDVALSLQKCWWTSNDLKEQAVSWSERVTTIRQARSAHYMEIRYEELVQSPEATLQRVCEYLDLPFQMEMLLYHRRAGERLQYKLKGLETNFSVSGEGRLALHQLLFLPPDPSRIGVWKRSMTEEDLAAVESVAGDLLNELGYQSRE